MTTLFFIVLGILGALGYAAYRILQMPLYTDLGPRLMRQMERDIMGHDAPRRQPDDVFVMLHEATRAASQRPPTIDADFEEVRPIARERLKYTTRQIGSGPPLRRRR